MQFFESVATMSLMFYNHICKNKQFQTRTEFCFKDENETKIVLIEFLKVQYIVIKATVTDEKRSVFVRLLTVKDTSGTNLRTSHPQFSNNSCQYREEDSEIKIIS